jgi:hypothetical protein
MKFVVPWRPAAVTTLAQELVSTAERADWRFGLVASALAAAL